MSIRIGRHAVEKTIIIPKGEHMKLTIKLIAMLALISSSLAMATHASEKSFGPYTVHYNAFSSDFLSPSVAKSYGITRSKNRAILNVTVTQKNDSEQYSPIEANISSKAFNVYQQAKPLTMRKIEEKDAIYYIAEFPVTNEETINFKIDVQNSTSKIGSVSFQQQFFH
jgi:hypothetical protein